MHVISVVESITYVRAYVMMFSVCTYVKVHTVCTPHTYVDKYAMLSAVMLSQHIRSFVPIRCTYGNDTTTSVVEVCRGRGSLKPTSPDV